MILKSTCKLSLRINETNTCLIYTQIVVVLTSLFISSVSAGSLENKSYLRIEQNIASDENDFKINSIGALVIANDMQGHVDLMYQDSNNNGNEWALDFGGGYVFNSAISLFLGLGLSLGHNADKNDYIAAYYPEVGVVLDITDTFGVTASLKRYYNRFQEDEDVVMLGLVFRN